MTLNLDLLKKAAEQFFMRLLPGDQWPVGAFNDKIEFATALHQRSRCAHRRR